MSDTVKIYDMSRYLCCRMHFNKGEKKFFLSFLLTKRESSLLCAFLSLNILTKNAGNFAEEFLIFSQKKTRSTIEPQMPRTKKERNVKEEVKFTRC